MWEFEEKEGSELLCYKIAAISLIFRSDGTNFAHLCHCAQLWFNKTQLPAYGESIARITEVFKCAEAYLTSPRLCFLDGYPNMWPKTESGHLIEYMFDQLHHSVRTTYSTSHHTPLSVKKCVFGQMCIGSNMFHSNIPDHFRSRIWIIMATKLIFNILLLSIRFNVVTTK